MKEWSDVIVDKAYINGERVPADDGKTFEVLNPYDGSVLAEVPDMGVLETKRARKRALVESVNDELKNICKLEHTRHRSVKGFLVNVSGALVVYCFLLKKPSLNIAPNETNQLSLWAA